MALTFGWNKCTCSGASRATILTMREAGLPRYFANAWRARTWTSARGCNHTTVHPDGRATLTPPSAPKAAGFGQYHRLVLWIVMLCGYHILEKAAQLGA